MQKTVDPSLDSSHNSQGASLVPSLASIGHFERYTFIGSFRRPVRFSANLLDAKYQQIYTVQGENVAFRTDKHPE